MVARSLTLTGNRKLIISTLDTSSGYSMQRPFVTLLPAFNAAERQQAESMTKALLDQGGVEFCCVGLEAEQLHDSLDEIIEARGTLDVVTTWHEDLTDACEYFLYAAAAGRANLLALISSHPELQSMLEEEARR
jgi:hypothetical protein